MQIKSLSARRAWIEMEVITEIRNSLRVALRKESVDRNFDFFGQCFAHYMSLSARRAWIEI